MKKSYIAALALFMILTACGKDKVEIEKTNEDVSITATDEFSATNSDSKKAEMEEVERVTAPEVTITVNKNIKLDITGKLEDCIKAVCDDGGGVLDSMQGRLYTIDENGTIFKEKDPFDNSASYITYIGIEQIPNAEMAKLGYINFYFEGEYTCDAFSLFDGWKDFKYRRLSE